MYLNDDYFLTNNTARKLYHEVAAEMPIIDFHTHLPQEEILNNHRFSNLWELWLKHDHYKWRLMRSCGVDETYITGKASPPEKLKAFASILHLAAGNPVHQWTHLELKRVFGIDEILCEDNVIDIWNETQKLFKQDPSLRVRGLLDKFNVEVICTTDDPASELATHRDIAKEKTTRVLPTFRPDKAMGIDKPVQFNVWTKLLSDRSGIEVVDYNSLIAALKKRHDDFHEAGCRLSDHGLSYCPTGNAKPTKLAELNKIFQNAVAGNAPQSEADWELFAASILQKVAKWNTEKGWAMQLHLGPLRNVNPAMFDYIGVDSGFDTMGNWSQTQKLIDFLAHLNSKRSLPRTIVYNLNPNESASICCALQNFQDVTCPGKMQYGPAWWFLDYKKGIVDQIDLVSNLGALGTSIGMLTDSRSFTSYVRHEYYRRLLCNYIGTAVDGGEIPSDPKLLTTMVENICYHNPKNYFNL